jgi:hypothetical protein
MRVSDIVGKNLNYFFNQVSLCLSLMKMLGRAFTLS